MPRQQSPATVVRHLRELLSRAENNDFTSMSQDRAIRFAIEAVLVGRNAKLETLRYVAANATKDGECSTCKKDGFYPNPNCNDHKPFDMPNDDAVDSLAGLIDMARNIGPR